nr:hypothetical protein [Angustibacter aerolatus]
MRITQGMISGNSLTNLQSNLERIGKPAGADVERPPPEPAVGLPAGISQALSLRSGIKANTQYASNAGDAVAWLGTIDTTLTSSNEPAAEGARPDPAGLLDRQRRPERAAGHRHRGGRHPVLAARPGQHLLPRATGLRRHHRRLQGLRGRRHLPRRLGRGDPPARAGRHRARRRAGPRDLRRRRHLGVQACSTASPRT